MPAPPRFRRSPRMYGELPQAEVNLPDPGTIPKRPELSLVAMLLPAGATLIGMAAMILLMGSRVGMMLAVSVPMLVGSYGVTWLNRRTQLREFAHDVQSREQRYKGLLLQERRRLEALRLQQQSVLGQQDPSPEECVRRVERLDRRLWERTPNDPDFLTLRVGTGSQPLCVPIKRPALDPLQLPDPLILRAHELAAEFELTSDLPVSLPLLHAGAAGLAGQRRMVIQLAQVMLLQLATHHTPDDVKLVIVLPEEEANDWLWARWLPHTWLDRTQRLMAQGREDTHHLLVQMNDLLNRRKQQIAMQGEQAGLPLPYFVFVFGNLQLIEGEPLLQLLLQEGPRLGALPLFLAGRPEALPKGCQYTIEAQTWQHRLVQSTLIASNRGMQGTQITGLTNAIEFSPDLVSVAQAERFARSMAAIQLQRTDTRMALPTTLPLLKLLDVNTVDELQVVQRWQQSNPAQTLGVPVGLRAGNEILQVNVHERGHGPHGLVAGMTRSGKTAFMSAFIALYAVFYHPHELALMVIDYKGGDLIRDLLPLPHIIGTITNLEGHLSTRALQSLKGEIKRREHLFNKVGVGNIYDYQRRMRAGLTPEPLPHLLIVSDEFAELVKEQPEFMQELVSTARVGGSLGIHLVLATQQPAGVVNDQIWGNSRFRICFRFGKSEDSSAVLKRPEAATITQSGRGYFQVGENEVFELFQAAWGGDLYAPDGVLVQHPDDILAVELNGQRRALLDGEASSDSPIGQTQLQAVAEYIEQAAQQAGIQRLPSPWLPPLPSAMPLEQLAIGQTWDGTAWQPTTRWLEPVIGLVDQPIEQRQIPLAIEFAKEGHIVIYGAPGSGKTTLLQTILIALARTHSPQEVHVYVLDFGGRLLSLFAQLPHVGAVITIDEPERLNRLLRYLRRELDQRKELFASVGVNTLSAYRASAPSAPPALVVLLDNYAGFSTTYPDAEDELALLAREGANLGIYLALTASNATTIRMKISSNIPQVLALQLSDRADYAATVGRTNGLEPQPVPGRGLVKAAPPLEFQTALPIAGATQSERSAALKVLMQQMVEACPTPNVTTIEVLPAFVPLCSRLVPSDAAYSTAPPSLAVPIGVDAEDLTTIQADLQQGPYFLITGPLESGKTTLLQTWLLALAESASPRQLELLLIDMRQIGLLPLANLPHVGTRYITDDAHFEQALSSLEQTLSERRQALETARRAAGGMLNPREFMQQYPAIVIAIDDFDAFTNEAQASNKSRLEAIMRKDRDLGIYVLLAANAALINASWDGIGRFMKELQIGMLLGSSDHNDLPLFNIRLPSGEGGKALPSGEGFMAQRGRFRKLKVATPHVGTTTLSSWIARIQQRALLTPATE